MKFLSKILLMLLISLSLVRSSFAQTDSVAATSLNKKRFVPMMVTVGAVYTATWVGLDALWYKNNPRTPFHFFNDDSEWLQLDKFGHATTSFQESRLGVDLLKWSGVPKKKAIIYGSLTGFILQFPIEVFDGFSAAYGASVGDLTANATGTLMVMSQHLLWDELRIHMKYSFHQTGYAHLRPNTLGDHLSEQLLKDYNGQTYWFCGNISSFMKKENRFPKWINLALGYGIQDMVYAQKSDNIASGFHPYRQYYLSIDVDLTRIKTKSAFLKKVFYAVNLLHLPAPALQYDKHGIKFHPIYF
ncbi:MAG TPA: DUF2279 domain-containing protein [Cytophagaceae bacterium]|nr:DUF2279 domain-containing protein [Cytophagaceae bacterium]